MNWLQINIRLHNELSVAYGIGVLVKSLPIDMSAAAGTESIKHSRFDLLILESNYDQCHHGDIDTVVVFGEELVLIRAVDVDVEVYDIS